MDEAMVITVSEDGKIYFDGNEYDRFDESFDLGTGVISLESSAEGSFFTVIPIASANYRATHATKARATKSLKNGWCIFRIYDDREEMSVLRIADIPENQKLIDKCVESLKNNRLL